jgi:hypothetical protein
MDSWLIASVGSTSLSPPALTNGLPAVEAACAEAIAHGVHSADVVLNILARHAILARQQRSSRLTH